MWRITRQTQLSMIVFTRSFYLDALGDLNFNVRNTKCSEYENSIFLFLQRTYFLRFFSLFFTGISESEEDKIKEILSSSDSGKSSITNYYTNSEIWLRAVLIAVPICGLMVLLILVFIAVRMLKSDITEDTFTSAKLM